MQRISHQHQQQPYCLSWFCAAVHVAREHRIRWRGARIGPAVAALEAGRHLPSPASSLLVIKQNLPGDFVVLRNDKRLINRQTRMGTRSLSLPCTGQRPHPTSSSVCIIVLIPGPSDINLALLRNNYLYLADGCRLS